MNKIKFNFRAFKCLILVTLSLSIFASSILSVDAVEAQSNSDDLYNKSSQELIENVDNLIEKRTEALLANDMATYRKIDKQLDSYGLTDISSSQIENLTGDKRLGQSVNSGRSANSTKTISGIKFENIKYKQKYKGKSYSIMRIVATPTGRSRLYKTGVTTLKNTNSLGAAMMQFLSAKARAAVGRLSRTFSYVNSVYDVCKTFLPSLSKTSVVTDIQASYTWAAAKTCAFIYVYKPNLGSYKLSARYHKASFSAGVSIPRITVKGKSAYTKIIQKSYSGIATPSSYGSTETAIKYYLKNAVYSGSVGTISVNGIQGKKVQDINIRNPQTPSEAGYL